MAGGPRVHYPPPSRLPWSALSEGPSGGCFRASIFASYAVREPSSCEGKGVYQRRVAGGVFISETRGILGVRLMLSDQTRAGSKV